MVAPICAKETSNTGSHLSDAVGLAIEVRQLETHVGAELDQFVEVILQSISKSAGIARLVGYHRAGLVNVIPIEKHRDHLAYLLQRDLSCLLGQGQGRIS